MTFHLNDSGRVDLTKCQNHFLYSFFHIEMGKKSSHNLLILPNKDKYAWISEESLRVISMFLVYSHPQGLDCQSGG